MSNMMMIKKITAIVGVLGLSISAACAQSSPNLTFGEVLTPAQWNAAFQSKQDYLGSPACSTGGCRMSGPLITAAPIATAAGFNLPQGIAPTSPNNGDLWTTSTGIFVRINGATVGPLIWSAAGSFAGTSPISVSFPAGVVTYACATCGVVGSPLSQFAATTSAQLRGVLSDPTGTGAAVFQNGALGTPTATSIALGGASIGSNALAVTGTISFPNNSLTFVELPSGISDTALGYWGAATASALAINNCSNALTYSTSTHAFGCNSTAGTGNVVNSGTPTNGQIAQWTNATTIQGVSTVPTANGGNNADNSTNTANDVLASNGANGNFVHTALLTVLNSVCTLSPSSCGFVFGYQNVTWWGAKCDGSTDDSTALQAAITGQASTGGILRIPEGGNCLFSTPLSLIGKNYITIQGSSSGLASAGTSSIWIYTGGATARAIDARDTTSDVFEQIALGWNNAAFAGIMVDYGSQTPGTGVSSYGRITKTLFTPFSSGSHTTITCSNFSDAISWTVEQTTFNYCNYGIHGENTSGTSTVGYISHNSFYQSNTAGVYRCGESWTVISNTFERLQSGLAGGFAGDTGGALPCKGIVFDGNWFGDATVDGGTWVSLFARGASIKGGRISGHSTTSNVGISVGGTGFSIEGVQFDTLSTAISAIGTPNGGIICGNTYASATVTTFIDAGMGSSVLSASCNASF